MVLPSPRNHSLSAARRSSFTLLVLIALAVPAFAGEPPPLPPRRHRLVLTPAKKASPPWQGHQVGVTEFYHGGLAQADGRDVIVADQSGVLPHSVLQAGPGDFLRVAFPYRDATVAIYFGGEPEPGRGAAASTKDVAAGAPPVLARAGALAPTSGRTAPPRPSIKLETSGTVVTRVKTWQPTAGLLLTTWPLPVDMGANSWKEMQKLLAACRQKNPYGCGFVNAVYHGYHAFSGAEKFVSAYEGWLGCPADGEYVFATSSDDASFLLVDGKLVVAWPGTHGAVGDARHQGKIKLTKGVHRLEYYHVNFGGATITCAAWQPPGKKKITPITLKSFAPVTRMRAEITGSLRGLMRVENVGEAWHKKTPLLRYRFTYPVHGSKTPLDRPVWHFGDGRILGFGSESVEHVFLTPGMRTIRVKVLGKEIVNRVLIQPDYSRSISRKYDKSESYLKQVAGYPRGVHIIDKSKFPLPLTQPPLKTTIGVDSFNNLSVQDLEVAIEVLSSAGKYHQETAAACRVLLSRKEIAPRTRFKAALSLGELLRNPLRQPKEAIAVYRQTLKQKLNRRQKAHLIRQLGDTLFYYLKDLPGALNEYDKVVGRYADALEANIVRVTKIKIGDIFRQRGQGAKARAAYHEAKALKLYQRSFTQDTVRKGALYKAADDYLRRRKTKEAKRWLEILEWEYPLEKMDGYSSILRADIALAENNPAEAGKQLLWFVVANPKSAYAAEAFYRAALLFQRQGKDQEVRRIVRKLKADYADSPYAERGAALFK